MQLLKLSFFALLSSYVAAQEIDTVPTQCQSVCASVISLTQTCDRQDDANDTDFVSCVCSTTNAGTLLPACEACVANFDRNDGSDNDVNDLIQSCSFTRITYVSTSTAGVSNTNSGSNSAATTTRRSASSVSLVSGTRTTVSASVLSTGSALLPSSNTSLNSSTTTLAATPISSLLSSVASGLSTQSTSTAAARSAYAVRAQGVVAGLVVAAWRLA